MSCSIGVNVSQVPSPALATTTPDAGFTRHVPGARALLHGGHDHLLATLHPTVHWRPPVLEVTYPEDRDLYLDGRGLLLQPSFFCWQRPVTVANPDLPPVLVYPIEHDPHWLHHDPQRATRTLVALLGRTRAAVLEAIADGCTTTGLARRLTISVASASQHATTLREAGLSTTYRDRNTVHHTITPLGLALINHRNRPAPAAGEATQDDASVTVAGGRPSMDGFALSAEAYAALGRAGSQARPRFGTRKVPVDPRPAPVIRAHRTPGSAPARPAGEPARFPGRAGRAPPQ